MAKTPSEKALKRSRGSARLSCSEVPSSAGGGPGSLTYGLSFPAAARQPGARRSDALWYPLAETARPARQSAAPATTIGPTWRLAAGRASREAED